MLLYRQRQKQLAIDSGNNVVLIQTQTSRIKKGIKSYANNHKKYDDVCSLHDCSCIFVVKIIAKRKNEKKGEKQSNNWSRIQVVTTSK
jgi:hypothetical protein